MADKVNPPCANVLPVTDKTGNPSYLHLLKKPVKLQDQLFIMPLLRTLGKNPAGKDLDAIRSLPNYSDGQFHNLSPTPMMAKGVSMPKMLWSFANKPANTAPPKKLPAVRRPLQFDQPQPVIVWFGHSSYLIYIDGLNILVDPVFSGYASPFSFTGKCFDGSNIYSVDDLPPIDLLLITHDHYDHLDYNSILLLTAKTKQVCTAAGVGSHLRYWGMSPSSIHEINWGEKIAVRDGITLESEPARHFSGRTFSRNKTLWSSYILKTGKHALYLGGDSGYDSHFKTIGEHSGPFDIAILESGQYNPAWPYIHMMPEETVQAAIDLRAKLLLPVHWGKFSLSLHPWDEPINRLTAKARELNMPVTTPMIGERVILDTAYPDQPWWTAL